MGINQTTAGYYFHRLRDLIYHHDDNGGLMAGEIEGDDSYCGGQGKGKRGRGAGGKRYWAGLNAMAGVARRP